MKISPAMQSSNMNTLRPVVGWYPWGLSRCCLTGSCDGIVAELVRLKYSVYGGSLGNVHRQRFSAILPPAIFPYVTPIFLVFATDVID